VVFRVKLFEQLIKHSDAGTSTFFAVNTVKHEESYWPICYIILVLTLQVVKPVAYLTKKREVMGKH
jgi:hypothetical protein